MTSTQDTRATVWSPVAAEFVSGTVYHETATYICIQTPAGRCVGGPKSILIPRAACSDCGDIIEKALLGAGRCPSCVGAWVARCAR